jgi:hypothetical protein
MPPISTKRITTSNLHPLIKEKLQYMALEIQVMPWDGHKSVARLHRLMGSLPPL